MTTETVMEQSIACVACGAAERIDEESERLPPGRWPAWEPGVQEFLCPACGKGPIWATEPYVKGVGPT